MLMTSHVLMSEPVENITRSTAWRAVDVLEENTEILKNDIENITEFQDAVEDFEPSGNGSAGKPLALRSESADTDQVMELYTEKFFERHETPDQVPVYAEKFDLSLEAADFFDELQGVANLNQGDALQKIKFLDGSNSMNRAYIDEVVSLAEYPKALRREVIEDVAVEKESIQKYGREVQQLEGRLVKLNREYTLPMDTEDAVHVVEELEDIEDTVEQLKNRREHELRRRPDILDPYFEKNLEKFYDDEDYDHPVLHDLEQLDEAVDEAYNNIVI